jgi:hypothetical protein
LTIRKHEECQYVEYNLKTKLFVKCKDHKCGDEDIYCQVHNKKACLPTESMGEEVSEETLEIGKQVYLAMQEGKSVEPVDLGIGYKKYGTQLVLEYCMNHYRAANNLMSIDEVDEE